MASYEELRKEYVKLAKRADQRLVRIEKRAEKTPELMQMAYRRAGYDLRGATPEGKPPRFNRAIPKSEKGIKRALKNVQRFLESKTSTYKGYKKQEIEKRTKSINEKFDTDFEPEDFTRVMQSSLIDNFGFYTTMDTIAIVQKNKEKLKELVEKARRQHKKLSDYKEFNEIYKDQDAVTKKVSEKLVRDFMREIENV